MIKAFPDRAQRTVSRTLHEYQKWVRLWTTQLTYCVSCDRPHLQQVNTGAGRFILGVVRLLWIHSNTAHDLHTQPAPSSPGLPRLSHLFSSTRYKQICILWLHLLRGLLANSISFLRNSTNLVTNVQEYIPAKFLLWNTRKWSSFTGSNKNLCHNSRLLSSGT